MPGKKPILWKVFPAFLLVIMLALGSYVAYSTSALQRFHTEQTRQELRRLALASEQIIASQLALNPAADLDAVCKDLGKRLGVRITAMAPNGVVWGDSDEAPTVMENHSGRQEMIAALQGRIGEDMRYSRTIRTDTLYVATPLMREGEVAGVVRTSMRLSKLDSELDAQRRRALLWAVGMALATAVLSFCISRRVSLPLERMRLGAERFAGGDFSLRLTEPGSRELSELAQSMNTMAEQLSTVIERITRQRDELQSVLKSMVEGVIAVNMDHAILTINQAAHDLLAIERDNIAGRPLEEVVRNTALRDLVLASLEQDEPIQGEIVHYARDQERILHVHGTALHSGSSARVGAVVVLHDTTTLRKLEQIRKDFVANVSHELRTPITNISGFVETLMDGAIDEPDDARRFLAIIDRHTRRLNAIIEDLLTLSQMERIQSPGATSLTGMIEARPMPLAGVLQAACQTCMAAADGRQIEIRLTCPEDLTATINPRLFEQAMVNLIENAVNYSEPTQSVEIVAEESGDATRIRIIDHGTGIANQHLDRIFERFYRVDKARSRDQGGTGLGLAIVKHIVKAHNGTVEVASRLNEGTTFTVRLPLPPVGSGD